MSDKRARKSQKRNKAFRAKLKSRNRYINEKHDKTKKEKLLAYTTQQIEDNRLRLESRRIAYEEERQKAYRELQESFRTAFNPPMSCTSLVINWKSEGF